MDDLLSAEVRRSLQMNSKKEPQEKTFVRQPPFRAGKSKERSLLYLSRESDLPDKNKRKQRESISSIMNSNRKPKPKKQSRMSSSATETKAFSSVEFNPSKLLKQTKKPGKFDVDFDSRWESFLELKKLAEARNRIYCASFFSLWKAQLAQRSMEKIEAQTLLLENTLSEFNLKHDTSKTSIALSASLLSSEELIERARNSIEGMNSRLRYSRADDDDLPKGYSLSSVSASERNLDQLMSRYRGDKWKDRRQKTFGYKKPDPNGEQSPFIGSMYDRSLDETGFESIGYSGVFDEPETRARRRAPRVKLSDDLRSLGMHLESISRESSNNYAGSEEEPQQEVSVSDVHVQTEKRTRGENSHDELNKLNDSENIMDKAEKRKVIDVKKKLSDITAMIRELSRPKCLSPHDEDDIYAEGECVCNRELVRERYEWFKPVSADFPDDIFNDVFTPGSERRKEYLSSTQLKSALLEL